MTTTVEATVETWQRYTDMDDWLTKSAKSPVKVLIPIGLMQRTVAASYNVPDAVGLSNQTQPSAIGLDTRLRFVFGDIREAVYFKTRWG